MLKAGDPEFVMMHALCRALTFLPETRFGDFRADLTQVLRAHVLSDIDARAADSLANLAPSALADLARHPVATGSQPDENHGDWQRQARVQFMFMCGLILANVGYSDGYALLGEALRESEDRTLEASVIEWVTRRGDSQGAELIDRTATEGLPSQRAVATMLLAIDDGGKTRELLADALHECFADRTEFRLEIAGLLHELGDERGTSALRELDTWENSWDLFHAITWLGPAESGRYQPKLEAIANGDAAAGDRIAAAMLLDPVDHDGAAGFLRAIAAGPWLGDDALTAAYYLLQLDQLGAAPALRQLGAEGESAEIRLGAAHLLAGVDAAAGAELLLRIVDAEGNWGVRWSAAKALEALDPAQGAQAQKRLRDTADPVGSMIMEIDPDGSRWLESGVDAITKHSAQLNELKESPRDHARTVAARLRQIDGIRPAEGFPPDPEWMMVGRTDPEAGMAPVIARRIDLALERDRRMLALAIPLYDVPGDREYLAAYASSKAPSDDWLRYLTQWSLGNFSSSILARQVSDEWVEALRGAIEILHLPVDWINIAWSAPGWIAERCFPLAMRYANTGALLEFSHIPVQAATPALAFGLCSGRTEPGLSAPQTRACVGRACYGLISQALANVDDKGVREVRRRYDKYSAQLVCDHGKSA